jgi:NAD(P)-dependent dehydrogenase (short-subunit alcohol dehydrogenase family)
MESWGVRAFIQSLDVANPDELEDAAAAIESELGPIDVWINNAMVSVFSPVIEMEPEEYRRVTEVTYLGSLHGTLAALRRMRPRDRGSIVQVGSALAYRGIPLQSAYCAAKHAIQGFLDSLRCELIHDGSSVKLSHVHLPAMNTPQFGWVKSRLPNKPQPVPPIYQPEIAADAIFWAAHHDKRELWVGMPTVSAILGNRIAPGLLERYLAANGVESQQTSEPADPNRPHNLWEPLPGDHGAHGTFDARAADFSPQAWAITHRRITLGALLAAGAAIAMGALSIGAERNSEEEVHDYAGPGPRERKQLRTLIEQEV